MTFLASARPHAADVQIVFADLQPELIASSTTTSPPGLAIAAGVLAKAARILGLPTTFCVVPTRGQPGRVIPELADHATSSNTISRTMTSPFMEARVLRALEDSGRKTLVITGFSAEVAVLHTALDGLAHGYSVLVPVDAIGSRSARTEAAAIRQIELAGGVTTSVLSLMTRLAPNIAQGVDAEVFELLQVLRSIQSRHQ